MERLQGPINHSCFFGEHLEHHHQVEFLEEKGLTGFEEELEAKMPFLRMLQSVETQPSLFPLKEPNFQTLLKLQHLKRTPWESGTNDNNHYYYTTNDMSYEIMETQIQGLDFDSCVTTTTHDHTVVDHSTTATTTYSFHDSSPVKSEEAKDHNQVLLLQHGQLQSQETQMGKSAQVNRERRKRKRTRPAKNKEEVETQRMTHIAVERNRRRQMNEHLGVLRSLMPNSYTQRGDQASIVGGAIDFVKELEQLLQSLEAQTRMRISSTDENSISSSSNSSSSIMSSSSSSSTSSSNGLSSFMRLSQFGVRRIDDDGEIKNSVVGDEVRAENKSETADIEATVIQTHVNLKVRCPKRPGQLLRAIAALEDLRLTVLHLNITSSHDKVLYSLNLKIEDGCKLGSADEIAGAVHQIFRIIDRS